MHSQEWPRVSGTLDGIMLDPFGVPPVSDAQEDIKPHQSEVDAAKELRRLCPVYQRQGTRLSDQAFELDHPRMEGATTSTDGRQSGSHRRTFSCAHLAYSLRPWIGRVAYAM